LVRNIEGDTIESLWYPDLVPVDARSQDFVKHHDYTIEAVYTGAAKKTMIC